MNANENKQLLQQVFAAMSNGDTRPFGNLLADDVRWTVIGSTRYSGTYAGKQAVYQDLIEPLFAQFADQYTNRAHNFIAENDSVAIEARGRVTTTAGKEYNNEYCYVFRLADGKAREVVEYCDTALIERTLE